MLKRIFDSPYAFWTLLALPSLYLIKEALGFQASYSYLLYESGAWSERLIVIALAITPLRMVFKGWRFPVWLMRRRRYIGIAAFGYALLHFFFFLAREGDLTYIFADIQQTWMWTGWVALAILVPLALTSNDWSIRRMGSGWKRLQQLAYLAAIFAFAHWTLHNWRFTPALWWFVPLVLLELYRIRFNLIRSRRPVVQAG
jgi:sulfoxide reductase heme-binding subunit YedZ